MDLPEARKSVTALKWDQVFLVLADCSSQIVTLALLEGQRDIHRRGQDPSHTLSQPKNAIIQDHGDPILFLNSARVPKSTLENTLTGMEYLNCQKRCFIPSR